MVSRPVTIATNSQADPSLRLPRGNVRRGAQAFPADEFTLVPNVPVFSEHKTTAKDGRELNIGPEELRAIADRCNRRIAETGDYAAVVYGHTPDPSNPNGQMPEMAGFAGPFRMGLIGEEGQRQRHAILADFNIFRDEIPKFKKHPRRSPEVWFEEDFGDVFLDPIALLSAECPRLDLGLLYSAERHGRMVEKYAAVSPGPGNVFIPGGDDDKRYSAPDTTNQKGTTSMLGPDDIRELVEALEQLDWVQAAKSMVQEQAGAAGTLNAPVAPPMEPAMAPPMEPAMAPAPPMAEAPMGDMPPAPPMADTAPPEAPPAADAGPPTDEPPMAPGPNEEPDKKYASANATGEYQDGTNNENVDNMGIDHVVGTDKKNYEAVDGEPKVEDGKEMMKKYAALDEMDDDEYEEYGRQRKSRRKAKYAADGSADGGGEHKAAEGTVEPDSPANNTAATVDDVDGEAAGSYQEAQKPSKFSRQAQERELYSMRQEMDGLRKQLKTECTERVNAERYSKLAQMRQFWTFDLEREVDRTSSGKMGDELFESHIQAISENYQRSPNGQSLPTLDFKTTDVTVAPLSQTGMEREKYSRDSSEQALRFCESQRLAGNDVDYETILDSILRGETPSEVPV